jgi:hypothetical protein
MKQQLMQATKKIELLESQRLNQSTSGPLDDYTIHLEEAVRDMKQRLTDAWAKWDQGKRYFLFIVAIYFL